VLDALPDSFRGLVLANEVLDALPVHIVGRHQGVFERGVASQGEAFVWADRDGIASVSAMVVDTLGLPENYLTEVCPSASALIGSLAEMLQSGLILLIDYGFPRREYYHPQRDHGTLMCHYRHHAHNDPFLYPGLQDITAHVDFSCVAQAAQANGAVLRGYCSQAQFLINCGITEILGRVSPDDMAAFLPLAAEAQKLLSPAEMGELFKVIAFAKGLEDAGVDVLLGFSQGDKSHVL
jgi:SAM-dependent MidA family methyltransferase